MISLNIGKGETGETMLANWLAVITEKDIEDKAIIKNICEEQEEIGMAVSELVRLSEDKVTRQAYQRRQDEIMLHNKRINDYENMKLRAEQESRRAEQESRRAEEESRRAETAESALVEKETTIADQARVIAELRSQLDKK